jgi:hypothetical protein
MFLNWATECGPFPPNGCLPSGRKRSDKKNYHLEFKIQIEQGSFLHKKLLRSKFTIVGIGPTTHGRVSKIFTKKLFLFFKVELKL